jgi:hypothetical protein
MGYARYQSTLLCAVCAQARQSKGQTGRQAGGQAGRQACTYLHSVYDIVLKLFPELEILRVLLRLHAHSVSCTAQAVRSGAVRCGGARCGAVRCGEMAWGRQAGTRTACIACQTSGSTYTSPSPTSV